jgi:hypothetical protein
MNPAPLPDAALSPSWGSIIKPVALSVVGATAFGAMAGVADAVDLATSFAGALGAAAGFHAVKYAVATQDQSSMVAVAGPVIGAFVVPGFIGGEWDSAVGILAAGAWAGNYIASKM